MGVALTGKRVVMGSGLLLRSPRNDGVAAGMGNTRLSGTPQADPEPMTTQMQDKSDRPALLGGLSLQVPGSRSGKTA